MVWSNLLFLHWRVPEAVIAERLPPGLEVDTFDGSAWIALVPFRMEETRFRGVPNVGGLGDFFECNVRTYAREAAGLPGGRGRRGVWFFSLDAEHLLPVLGGRLLWSLNYVYSRFEVRRDAAPENGERTDYSVISRLDPQRRARVVWRRGAALPPTAPGSLEEFLTERYWLFTHRRGRVLAARVEHHPWNLREATVEHVEQSLTDAAGVAVNGEMLAWHSDRIDVIGWKLGEAGPEDGHAGLPREGREVRA